MGVGSIDTGSKSSPSAANPYAGTQYSSMWDSNPYRKNTRKDSIWDKLGNFFGIRTGADKWQDELDVRSQEYDAQLASIVREEEYNSESAKVARMRAAGLNPDLMGLDQASTASEFSEPETSPESSAEVDSLGSAVGSLVSLGTGFTKSLLEIGNMMLSLEEQGLVLEGLANDNAANQLNLVSNAASAFDMPDLDLGPVEEGQEGIEGVILQASEKISGRNLQIADALYGFPRSRSARKSKADFVASMNRHNGTLDKLNKHLVGELTKATLSGDLNAAKAALQGRKSASNAPILEKYLLRSVMNDLQYDMTISDINLRFASNETNQDNILKSMENDATSSALTDPTLAAKAANALNAGIVSDVGASMEEDKARRKQAALDAADAEYKKEQLEIVKKYYEELIRNNGGVAPRKVVRQYRNNFGLGPVNEPSTGLNVGGNATGSYRKSSSISKATRTLIK